MLWKHGISFKGVADPDKIQQELANVCRNNFNIRINPKICVNVVEGRSVVVAFIPEAFCRDKPVYRESSGIEKGSFRRIGSSDYRCTPDDLDQLYQLRRQQNYESEVLSSLSWEDISQEAVEAYRYLRSQREPGVKELKLDDKELLLSLKIAVKQRGDIVPTIGGVLLFGTKAALRRELPMDARVDYIIVEGTKWVEDPSKRYQFAFEYREALVTLMPRLHSQIMTDIPTKFGLETGELQRTDTPYIPRDVIREAVANALMHRDYRSHQPTQIIRYANRLEFRNAGYSLKPMEELGEPGSKQRNPKIAAVFHELKHAETKGTGIRSMREWMQEAGLTTPPIIETDRDRNEFDLILLPHHLLDHRALKWLSQFKDIALSDAQRRALAFTRELGAITNQDYRQLNGTDTLTASAALRRLRDTQLLTQKGKGNRTYYTLVPDKEETYQASLPDKGLVAIPSGFPKLPERLEQQIISLGKRSVESKRLKEIITGLCSLSPLTKKELAKILDRNPNHLKDQYLLEMIRDKKLEYLYPDKVVHPKQAYLVPEDKI